MAKKRANGEGNIRKRKDGRWEGRYTAGYDEKTGKRLIKIPFTNAACVATFVPENRKNAQQSMGSLIQIGRASCRERV